MRNRLSAQERAAKHGYWPRIGGKTEKTVK